METLGARIKRDGPLNELDAVGWAIRIAKHLESLHVHGVAHGGVSPELVLVEDTDRHSQALLGDVRRLAEAPQFQSPERLSGGELSPADDTWALAATLYAMLTGQPPFAGEGAELLNKAKAGAPAPLAVFDVGDDDLQRILADALSADPRRRLRDTVRLRGELERWHPDPDAANLAALEDEDANDDDQKATRMAPVNKFMPAFGAGGPPRPTGPAATPPRPAAPPPAAGAPPRPAAPPLEPPPSQFGIGAPHDEETVMRELPAEVMAMAARAALGSSPPGPPDEPTADRARPSTAPTPPPPRPDAAPRPAGVPRPSGAGQGATGQMPAVPPMPGGAGPARPQAAPPLPPVDPADLQDDPDDVRTVMQSAPSDMFDEPEVAPASQPTAAGAPPAPNAPPSPAAGRPPAAPVPPPAFGPPPAGPASLPDDDDDDEDGDEARTVMREAPVFLASRQPVMGEAAPPSRANAPSWPQGGFAAPRDVRGPAPSGPGPVDDPSSISFDAPSFDGPAPGAPGAQDPSGGASAPGFEAIAAELAQPIQPEAVPPLPGPLDSEFQPMSQGPALSGPVSSEPFSSEQAPVYPAAQPMGPQSSLSAPLSAPQAGQLGPGSSKKTLIIVCLIALIVAATSTYLVLRYRAALPF